MNRYLWLWILMECESWWNPSFFRMCMVFERKFNRIFVSPIRNPYCCQWIFTINLRKLQRMVTLQIRRLPWWRILNIAALSCGRNQKEDVKGNDFKMQSPTYPQTFMVKKNWRKNKRKNRRNGTQSFEEKKAQNLTLLQF